MRSCLPGADCRTRGQGQVMGRVRQLIHRGRPGVRAPLRRPRIDPHLPSGCRGPHRPLAPVRLARELCASHGGASQGRASRPSTCRSWLMLCARAAFPGRPSPCHSTTDTATISMPLEPILERYERPPPISPRPATLGRTSHSGGTFSMPYSCARNSYRKSWTSRWAGNSIIGTSAATLF